MKFSVTSVSLPDLDVRETCTLLQRLGYDGVEWRVRYTSDEARQRGYSFWGAHKTDLSPANLAERADEVARITADHGLQIAGIASNLRADEYDEIRRLADGVARLGQVPIRLGAPRGYDRTTPYPALYEQAVDAYTRAVAILRPYGLRALIEIHGGTIMVSASLAHRIASHFSPGDGRHLDVNVWPDEFREFRLGMDLWAPTSSTAAGGWRRAGDRAPTAPRRSRGCDWRKHLDIPSSSPTCRRWITKGFISSSSGDGPQILGADSLSEGLVSALVHASFIPRPGDGQPNREVG